MPYIKNKIKQTNYALKLGEEIYHEDLGLITIMSFNSSHEGHSITKGRCVVKNCERRVFEIDIKDLLLIKNNENGKIIKVSGRGAKIFRTTRKRGTSVQSRTSRAKCKRSNFGNKKRIS